MIFQHTYSCPPNFSSFVSPQAEDKKKGGIDIRRFQELYAQFIGNPDETIGAVYLFGPLQELN